MNVFDFTIGMERSAQEFYKKLAGKTDNKGLKTIFDLMVADEEQLCKKIETMRCLAHGSAFEDSMNLQRFREVFSEGFDEDAVLSTIGNDLDAYQFIMKWDADRVRFYKEVAEAEDNLEVKKLLLGIVDEEYHHYDSMERLYDFTNAPNQHLAWQEFSNLSEFKNFGRQNW